MNLFYNSILDGFFPNKNRDAKQSLDNWSYRFSNQPKINSEKKKNGCVNETMSHSWLSVKLR